MAEATDLSRKLGTDGRPCWIFAHARASHFDPELEVEYLRCFASTEKMLYVIDELDTLYEGLETPGEGPKAMGIIGNPNVFFHDTEEENSDEKES